MDLTGLANNEARVERGVGRGGEDRDASKVFSSKCFHEVDRLKCKGGYNMILKCINCGTEGQSGRAPRL